MWVVPATPYNADRILKSIRPEVDEELLNWIRMSMTKAEETLTSPLPGDAKLLVPWADKRCPWQPETVNDEPVKGAEPWQRAAIDKMATVGRAILADDIGLGKTFESITAVEEWVLRNPNKDGTLKEGPKLVIAPASVVGGWKRELERWLEDPEVVIVDGKNAAKRQEQILDGVARDGWVLCNWEQLRVQKTKVATRNGGTKTVKSMKEPLFEQTEWLAVIADEVHKAKNPKAQQTQGLWRCTGEVMLGLSGTPLMNSPDELWSILRWLWPEEYHELGARKNAVAYWSFYEDYVDYWEDHFKRKVITGVKNPDALRFVLKDKLIRRTAAILGLKGRKRFFFPVVLNPAQQKLYDEAEKAMWLAVQSDISAGNKEALAFAQAAVEGGGAVANLIRIPNGAARMVRLQQVLENSALLGGPDDSAIMDDFEEKFSNSRPSQWVVFCKFKESCNLLASRLREKHGAEVGIYNGDVKASDRTKLEDRFQRGEIDVMVGTTAAMYQGINLQNAHLMYFLTRDWVPAVNDQCEGRQDRKGQKELVRVYVPQPPNSVATDNVAPTNALKQTIERTVLPKDKHEEVHTT